MATLGILGLWIATESVPAQEPLWLREFGGFGDDASKAVCVTLDGGCFVAGDVLAAGGDDIFLAKFNESGGMVWSVQFGAGGTDSVSDSCPDGGGGLFLAGDTGGSFGGPSAGGVDAWFARCDSAGNRTWVRQFGTAGLDRALAIVPDGLGGVFVGGMTAGAPGGGYNWITRYDGAGRQLWMIQLTTATVGNLAPDGDGGVFAAGTTSTSFAGPHMGLQDTWLLRLDADGKQMWGRQLGTAAEERPGGLAEDGNGGVLITGFTLGSLFGPNAGSTDVWVVRYDRFGGQNASLQFGTPSSESPSNIARDGMGGAFLTGNVTASNTDVWVARLGPRLGLLWFDQFGSPVHDQSADVAFAGPGSAFVCGWTLGDLPGTSGGGGNADPWVARYSTCYPDCNTDGALTVTDFGCFQTRFVMADMYADCNADGVLTVSDFGCFQTKFVVGCP